MARCSCGRCAKGVGRVNSFRFPITWRSGTATATATLQLQLCNCPLQLQLCNNAVHYKRHTPRGAAVTLHFASPLHPQAACRYNRKPPAAASCLSAIAEPVQVTRRLCCNHPQDDTMAAATTLASVADRLWRNATAPEVFTVYVEDEWRDPDKFTRRVSDDTMGHFYATFSAENIDKFEVVGGVVQLQATLTLVDVKEPFVTTALTIFGQPKATATGRRVQLTHCRLLPPPPRVLAGTGAPRLPEPALTNAGCIFVHEVNGTPRVLLFSRKPSMWWLQHGFTSTEALRDRLEQARRNGTLPHMLKTWRWSELELASQGGVVPLQHDARGTRMFSALTDDSLRRDFLAQPAAEELQRRRTVFGSAQTQLEVPAEILWDVCRAGCRQTVTVDPEAMTLDDESKKLLRAWCSALAKVEQHYGAAAATELKGITPDRVRILKVRDTSDLVENLYFVVRADDVMPVIRRYIPPSYRAYPELLRLGAVDDPTTPGVVPWPQRARGRGSTELAKLIHAMENEITQHPDTPALVCPDVRSETDAVASVRLDALEKVTPTLWSTVFKLDAAAAAPAAREAGDGPAAALEWAALHQHPALKYLRARGEHQFLDALRMAACDLLG